ncbi:NAD(P)-dependent oxidoreductase [Aneurinibacillus sp. Ricciae_BoGa-3]|uniref:NAD(P)-dependent oxidoreductase n=1 Tax=Aneurinibacillus sp. Ricciae_BoGa-3 TaxID=3022697 RepID=UPI0023428775|nr:NAD(P)-dependent oxidoreductase [Aneurinibacillus sp. Ricciae_BoGa-3]WCK53115.1 NAD(P)-dependent oxidoreductase [Aneurinibacillus sp. Ricciae_BoGa-3]
MSRMKVGFIGLGTMGLPMTMNLLKSGFEVHVVSRSRGPIEKAVAAGAIEASDAADLASKVQILLTCLPMPHTVEDIYLGSHGVLSGSREGLIIADHSTVSPQLNQQIYNAAKEKGVHFLDAPISGGPMGAEAGSLTIMCGGDERPYQTALPVFEAMGRKIVLVGPVGSGSVVKLINNMLFGINVAAVSEVMVLAEKAGIPQDTLHEIIKVSTGHSLGYDRIYPLITARNFAPLFSVDLLYKDMKIAVNLAQQLETPLGVGRTATEMVGAAQAQGYGSEDVAATIRAIEDRTGIAITTKQ